VEFEVVSGSRFNPTLVRLRLLDRVLDPVPAAPFQSHAGSIEAIEEIPGTRRIVLFQSHAGSIEAPKG